MQYWDVYCSTILDAIDVMELMEVDDDPNADQIDTDEDQLGEVKTLGSTCDGCEKRVAFRDGTSGK